MKRTELRIGNLVERNGKIHEVSSIHADDTIGIFVKDKNGSVGFFYLRVINPIPLTEEILLINCRFKKSPHDIRFKTLNSIKLKTTEKGFKFNYGESIIYIKYVHQLQNLYFALTGEELIIKN
jgi:hypothetical protein